MVTTGSVVDTLRNMTTSFILLPDSISNTALAVRQWISDLALPKDLSRVLCYFDQLVPVDSFYWTGALIDCPPKHPTIDSGPLPWYMTLYNDPVWATIISVLLISILPLLILLPVLARKKTFSQYWLHALLVFGAGGLIGDTLLHLLPESYHLHGSHHHHHHGSDHAMNHNHLKNAGLAIFAGIFLFWAMDFLLSDHSQSCEKKKTHVTTSPGEQHAQYVHESSPIKTRPTRRKKSPRPDLLGEKHAVSVYVEISANDSALINNKNAMLHLLADFLHNFTDGLALSAAWITSRSEMTLKHMGPATTLAILLHEIPHELGDIAALVKLGGMSLFTAIWSQLLTAIGALLGALVGLCIGLSSDHNQSEPIFLLPGVNLEQMFNLILPFTAGTFLYLSMSMMLPQLKAQQGEKHGDYLGFFGCALCFSCGFLLLSLC